MFYNEFAGQRVSALGLGCMRFPTLNEGKDIDVEKTREIVALAMKSGINYYDTAWGYHGGLSESVMGELLSEYPRQSFYLASKFPGYDLSNMDKVEEIFEKQLKKCRVDYFDFYLFHSVTEENIDAYLDEKHGIRDYLVKQKREGRIKHLGFSTHGTLSTMKRFLDAYAADLEFCQIQVNWLDWSYQNAEEKIKLVTSYGLPVIVMEPVRGGKLCNLEPSHEERLAAVSGGRALPEWAFRFIHGIPEVVLTLSGMSNLDQLRENIATFEERRPLPENENAVLMTVAEEMSRAKTIQCTACRYCTEKCPQGLDIPWLIDLFNESSVLGRMANAKKTLAKEPPEESPSNCIGCRACESVCPQGIEISDVMTRFAKRLER